MEKPTHVRCVNDSNKARYIACMVAENTTLLTSRGWRIEDPQWEAYKKSLEKPDELKAVVTLAEVESPVQSVEDATEEIKEGKVNTKRK